MMPVSSPRISGAQLRKVFRLCDPEHSGRVSVQHLSNLALQYAQSKVRKKTYFFSYVYYIFVEYYVKSKMYLKVVC